ncbi:RcpC/CpaB family pilus assembly protein [Phycicoccus sp. SLBN-51]|uniref:Flp pilus assembly protein CpaB n=1 Tax=Phycicoccus sp. SLBN-51 TaxID=2768447 RepID=UPI00114EF196|nr:RcpC/CpaB family pilus assembly protein [Phycicoccus sp. SLBN-51]TQJ51677.1 pilus assembly protein CpaB [Phycicoccus sp. SLBN-51]
MGRRIIAIFAAAAVALLGVVSVLVYAKGADARAVSANQPVDAYIAEKVVPAGTTLKDAVRSGMLVKTTAAAKGLPQGALARVTDSNSSLLALTDIQPGEFVMSARFGTTPKGSTAIQVPAGMVAVSVELSDPARVGTFVTPGTHIAIFDSYKIKAIGTDEKSKAINDADIQGTSVLLEDVLVIAMGQTALTPGTASAEGDSKDTKDKGASSDAASFLVTVAVPPKDAPRLIHGINTGKLYAALRGEELKMNDANRVDDLNIFNLQGVGK